MWAKNELRAKLKNERKALSSEFCEEGSAKIVDCILDYLSKVSFSSILLYSSIQNEPDLNLLFEFALKNNIAIFYPKTYEEEIQFYRVKSKEDFIPGKFHVLEPKDSNEIYDGHDNDAVIIVPGIAFRDDGYRIGFGKGYYDRYLNKHREMLSIGIGYDFQFHHEFENDYFDETLKVLISDMGMVK